MRARLNYQWRVVATGLGMFGFGIAGLALSLLVFPLVCLWPAGPSLQRLVTGIVHRYFKMLVAVLQAVGVMRLQTEQRETLAQLRGALVIANHPTYLDIMALLSLIPHACCVVKHKHWRNPCFWGIMRAASYVSNADPVELVHDGARQLAAGYSLIMFPEGTRSPAPGHLHPFSRGFAHMALLRNTPIVPVLIDCDPPVFTKRMRWYHVPPRPFCMRITVLEAIDPCSWADTASSPTLAARTVTHAMQALFTRHLVDHGFAKV